MAQYAEKEYSAVFDQSELFSALELEQLQAHEIGKTILQISQLTIDFANIERIPRYCKDRRENNAEHSFMLALAGIEIVSTYYPGLDAGLASSLALVHDIPEIKTDDVATFDISDEQLQQKYKAEAESLPALLEELPTHIADLLSIYEEQKMPEARVIRHLDKLLPHAVNISGAGKEVMNEDYSVTTVGELMAKNQINETRFQNMFPEEHHVPLHQAHSVLAQKFALTFIEM